MDPNVTSPPDQSAWDRFVAWIRSLFADDPGTGPPATPPGGPPPTTLDAIAASEAGNCEHLIQLVRHYGAHGGSAMFELAIQQTIMASGTAAGVAGGPIGALVGAIAGGVSGTAVAAAAQQKCKQENRAAFDAAAAAWVADRHIMDAEFEACKTACRAAHPHRGLGPRGKAYRDCMKACHDARQARRRAMHHANGSPGGEAGEQFLP